MNKLAFSLIGCLLIGCAHATKDALPSEGHAGTTQPSVRAIIHFSHSPAADSQQLLSVISEACRCHPVFFRQFGNNALIYQISLPENHSFTSFEKALRANGTSLGIQAVEQDKLMRHQH